MKFLYLCDLITPQMHVGPFMKNLNKIKKCVLDLLRYTKFLI